MFNTPCVEFDALYMGNGAGTANPNAPNGYPVQQQKKFRDPRHKIHRLFTRIFTHSFGGLKVRKIKLILGASPRFYLTVIGTHTLGVIRTHTLPLTEMTFKA